MTTTDSQVPAGILIVTHASFGEELIRASELILGPQQRCQSLTVDTSIPMEEMLAKIREATQELDQGNGTIIFTDMFGGTPSNLSLSLLGSENIEVVTGVNLPMLLKILSIRTKSLAELSVEAKSAGKAGIIVAGEVLKRKVGDK